MKTNKDIAMYFNKEVSSKFAAHEQNDKNFRVAAIIDRLIINKLKDLKRPFYCVDLGAGAHPDRYHQFFKELLKVPKSNLDWVDVSPIMLKLAKEYINNDNYKERFQVINFIEKDIYTYLQELPSENLDIGIMKYTFDHLMDIDLLFKLLSQKLKKDGSLIAHLTTIYPELKSVSTNVRFLYQEKEFPENETRTLKDGESFTIKFFKISGKPELGFIEGGETTKYYHSPEKIKILATKYNFKIFLGDWKDYLPKEQQDNETLNQEILILEKL